jgi:hypothetical protein
MNRVAAASEPFANIVDLPTTPCIKESSSTACSRKRPGPNDDPALRLA